MNRMLDPYEPTPEGFHRGVERKLNELRRANGPARRSHRWVAALAACVVLLCGTAFAVERMGVLYFLTERVYRGDPVDAAVIVQPVSQSCDSALLNVVVRDAYWDGETLSLTVSIQPKGDYAFYTETDRGCDGESFDKIWWNGEILPYEEWLAGRQPLMLRPPYKMKINGKGVRQSWDWVQSGQGVEMLLEGEADDLTQGAELTFTLESVLEGTDTTEQATLTVQLPPMKKGEPKQ